MTQGFTGRINVFPRSVLAFAAIAAIVGTGLFGFLRVSEADSQAQSTNSGPLSSFEVASIKPNHSGGGMFRIGNSPGRFSATNATAKMLIQLAYGIKGPELSGGPSWIDSERFDIDAKAGDNSDDLSKQKSKQIDNQRKLMLQSLLADRFQLRLTHQMKELPVYALVVAKNGPKFHESATPVPDPAASSNQAPRTGQPVRGRVAMRRGELDMMAAPISTFADALSGQLGRRVVDETGLKGNYDLKLQWAPDETQGPVVMGAGGGGPDVRPAGESATAPDTGPAPISREPALVPGLLPSIFTALEEQLGLKLASRNAAVDTLVIEHIERPSEN